MLRKMRWGVGVAMVLSVVGSSLVFAQGGGMSGGMQDKAMSPPSTSGGASDKAGMSGDKMPLPMEKGGMGMEKSSMPMEKGSMGKAGMGMEKSSMPMEKDSLGKAGMAAKKVKVTTESLDINTADEAALKSLKGVGAAKAKAIVAYRQQHGPFKSVDEIEKVPGIGKKTLAGMKDRLTIGKGL